VIPSFLPTFSSLHPSVLNLRSRTGQTDRRTDRRTTAIDALRPTLGGRGIIIITSCARGRHNMSPAPVNWPFDLESGVRVMCDVSYLCANFSFPMILCSRLRPDVCNRQTSDAHRRLIPPPCVAGHNNNNIRITTKIITGDQSYNFIICGHFQGKNSLSCEPGYRKVDGWPIRRCSSNTP